LVERFRPGPRGVRRKRLIIGERLKVGGSADSWLLPQPI
jgi:hypothetical protein